MNFEIMHKVCTIIMPQCINLYWLQKRVCTHTEFFLKWCLQKQQHRILNLSLTTDFLPTIPEFTATSAIHAKCLQDPVPINFLGIFLDKEFYNYLTHQTILYAAQYLHPNPDLLPVLLDVSLTEMTQFMSPYLLKSIVRKPELIGIRAPTLCWQHLFTTILCQIINSNSFFSFCILTTTANMTWITHKVILPIEKKQNP